MTQPIALGPYYRYFALVFLAATAAIAIGSVAYEAYVGPLPKGLQTGLWLAPILSASSAAANRFVQMNRRSPTAEEKKRLARVSLVLAVAIGMLPGLALFAWVYGMAFVVADPAYQLAYYMHRQQALSLVMEMGAGLWMLMAAIFAAMLAFTYLALRWQYGRYAEKMAARLSAE